MHPVKPLHSTHVLAVDDKPGNLIALEATLASECELIQAHSGPEAIKILQTRQDIDVILMDLQMPGMDGYQATAEIKKIKGCEEIPIIFITAIYKEEPFIKKGYEAGGVDYFSKPFDPEILKKKIAIYSSFRKKHAVLLERERQIEESEKLLKAGRKLSALLETLPVGVVVADLDGHVTHMNAETARICGCSQKGENHRYKEIVQWWESQGKFQDHTHQEVTFPDGSRKTILTSTSHLYGLDDAKIGLVTIVQDITESEGIQKDLQERVTRIVSLGVGAHHL